MVKDTTNYKDQQPYPPGAAGESTGIPDKTDLNNLNSVFVAKRAKEWGSDLIGEPLPKQLFGNLWIEGEICVLFAPTNVGKSILAVQIADYITNGEHRGFADYIGDPPSEERTVIYFDFELSERQFAKRYGTVDPKTNTIASVYDFSSSFIRCEPDPGNLPTNVSVTDAYINAIQEQLEQQSAKIAIIDNLTWLSTKLEKSEGAGPFMQKLMNLKRKHGLSILIIAHTRKKEPGEELSINDLKGSSTVGDFMDSAFAINHSVKGDDIRYIKQIKVRDGEKKFGRDNVLACTISKHENFVELSPTGKECESGHVKREKKQKLTDEEKDIAKELCDAKNYKDIADELGVSKAKITRTKKKLRRMNLIDENGIILIENL